MRRGPRLLVQLLAGNLITTLPLLLAITYALASLQSANSRQQQLLFDGVAATRMGILITDQLKQLERAVRQHRVLGDEEFGGVVDTAYRKTLTILLRAEIELPVSLEQAHGPVGKLQQQLEQVPQLLQQRTPDAELASYFAAAAQQSTALSEQIQAWLDEQLRLIEAEHAATGKLLSLLGILALALTMLVAALAAMLVARPLRSVRHSINTLGLGNWDQPVVISGPADLVELGDRLEWLRGQLLDTESEKRAFVRNITHELKTPLAAVMEAAALLAEGIPGTLTPRQQEVLGLLRNNAAGLQEMIEQLLSYDGVAQAAALEQPPFALRDLVDSAMRQVASLIAAKRVHTDVVGENVWCRVDRRRLQLIIGNLLSNAVRHSPQGGVLSLHWQAVGPVLQLSVTDDGEGVAPEHLDKIFTPFFTAGSRSLGAHRGTGLGLAIVHECVTRLGGRISVSNVTGRGACFQVTLPNPIPAGGDA